MCLFVRTKKGRIAGDGKNREQDGDTPVWSFHALHQTDFVDDLPPATSLFVMDKSERCNALDRTQTALIPSSHFTILWSRESGRRFSRDGAGVDRMAYPHSLHKD